MPCSSTRCSGRPPYVPFPLTAGVPLMGSCSCCTNSPSGLRPHLMPGEQRLPWHPVATGLAGQAIPFVVAASHAHATGGGGGGDSAGPRTPTTPAPPPPPPPANS